MDPPKKKAALELMKKAADLLMESDDKDSASTSQPSGSSTPVTVSSASGSTVSDELKRLFKPYATQNIFKKSTHPTRPKSSTKRTLDNTPTWTHKFCCLSGKNQDMVPNAEERRELFEAGLGDRKLLFKKIDDPIMFTEVIESAYPQLKDCGGWELLRTSGTSRSSLNIIKPKKDGYSAEYLAMSYLGQAICYIRPIQEDLKMMSPVYNEEDTLKKICKICQQEVSLINLRQHVELCSENNEQNIDENLPIIKRRKKDQPICSFLCMESGSSSEGCILETTEKLCPVCWEEFDEFIELEHHAAKCGEKCTADVPVSRSEDLDEVNHKDNSIKRTIEETSEINDAKLVVDVYQKKYLRGRDLDVFDETIESTGKINEIFVSRENLLDDAISEFQQPLDFSYTLVVNYIGEEAYDLGGPRREFLSSCLRDISDRFFLNGVLMNEVQMGKENYLRHLKNKSFEAVGSIVGLSLLQGGPIPMIFEEPEKLFFSASNDIEEQFIRGLNKLGLIELCYKKKSLLSLFDMNLKKVDSLTYPKMVKLLKVDFAEEGSNIRNNQNNTYRLFLDYLKEVSAHRRGNLNLNSVLKFITGSNEAPLLGYKIQPSINFTDSENLIPTCSTCLCKLFLSTQISTKSKTNAFELYDFAFANDYFGIV